MWFYYTKSCLADIIWSAPISTDEINRLITNKVTYKSFRNIVFRSSIIYWIQKVKRSGFCAWICVRVRSQHTLTRVNTFFMKIKKREQSDLNSQHVNRYPKCLRREAPEAKTNRNFRLTFYEHSRTLNDCTLYIPGWRLFKDNFSTVCRISWLFP